jgi:hypothetical protein
MAVRLLLGFIAWLSLVGVAAGTENPVWHTVGGEVVEGELTEVFGSVIMVTGKSVMQFVSLTTLTDAETGRVAEFLRTRRAAPVTWGKSTAKITKRLRGHIDLLHDGMIGPIQSRRQARA